MNDPLGTHGPVMDGCLETLATDALFLELSDLAARHKDEGDSLSKLPPVLAEAFLRHDVYRLILPRDLGGAEVSPLE